ncbi:MAG: 4Fe-4S dicluster domain-containing protein [Candidatus Omnitrophica bacterium]|nr:4Fe-4S dicluster domain-containing protein [Candidatus Omnitrophota bacterium]
MNEIYYIVSSSLDTFFNHLKKRYPVFVPAVKDSAAKEIDYNYCLAQEDTPFLYNAYRTTEPLKVFFTPVCEKLVDYFTPQKNITEITQKTIIFGIKSCDIFGHKVQDFVFLEGAQEDSLYRLRRENIILISSDCTNFKEVCHCLAWEILPYPTEGFDLNFSCLNDGYLVEVGSQRGKDLINEYKEYFSLAKETQVSSRQVKRQNLIERLRRHLLPQNLVSKESVQKLVRQGYNADTWKEFMLTCVECGGCNFICDTCHCFLLADQRQDQINKKIRVWDSCLYANYARVAGGANPLNTRAKRLRNRFMKKFDFFVDNLGFPACCGCGRCIEVCPGKIDIREVLKDLAKKVALVK